MQTLNNQNIKTDLLHARTIEFLKTVNEAHNVIKVALIKMKNPYLSFSGGKDSTTLLHMMLKYKPDIPVVYWDAVASYSETEQFLKKIEKEWNVQIIRRKTEPILSVFDKFGITHPNIESKTMNATVYKPIKQLLKEYSFDGVFLGLRAEESINRSKLIRYRGQIFFSKTWNLTECLPVGLFNTQDIWSYISTNNLPYNPVYDKTNLLPRNEIRVSYWCGESCRERGRWLWLKKEYPELFNTLASSFPEVREFV